jgi:hypothetical protein
MDVLARVILDQETGPGWLFPSFPSHSRPRPGLQFPLLISYPCQNETLKKEKSGDSRLGSSHHEITVGNAALLDSNSGSKFRCLVPVISSSRTRRLRPSTIPMSLPVIPWAGWSSWRRGSGFARSRSPVSCPLILAHYLPLIPDVVFKLFK